MSDTPELDQVAAARRKVADQLDFPLTYWVFLGIALVFFMSVPLLLSWLPRDASPYLSWAIAAVGISSAVYSFVKRRRSGVYLPKRIGAYPSARPLWMAEMILSIAGFIGMYALVNADQRGYALALLPVLAIAIFVLQLRTRSAMRRDIEAGRVTP
ncbi:hypothetical protein [Pseudonocardia sp. HH130630-07]|uniref:hypothetical protein n=1 Tax=Pseudonocardia sp. HH130630-07 TaxID=1690815 RepID=UPI000814ED97|nr:hypothetical protein [Pseudonocardia sp. HH130630-07]ANY09629.1 hypothetical protein AFB00_29160 [Pseudonocardia sp. HH130630-07]